MDEKSKNLVNEQISKIRNTFQCSRVLAPTEPPQVNPESKWEPVKDVTYMMITDFLGEKQFETGSLLGNLVIQHFFIKEINELEDNIKHGNLILQLTFKENSQIQLFKSVPIFYKSDEMGFHCNTFIRKLI